jgi:hypothetical protein
MELQEYIPGIDATTEDLAQWELKILLQVVDFFWDP